MAILNIRRGENVLYTVPIMSADDTPVPVPIVANLVSCSVEIIQYGRVLATYILLPTPDPVQNEIKVGAQTHYLNVEVTEELSERFREGAVNLKVYMRKTDATFPVDLELRDIDEFQFLSVT